jgi:Nuclear protein 96
VRSALSACLIGNDLCTDTYRADHFASNYASQLEAHGMMHEALFVLLHIERSVGFVKFSGSFAES